MATITSTKTISIVDGTLTFLADGEYSFKALNSGRTIIDLEAGQDTVLTKSQFDGITAYHLTEGTGLTVDASFVVDNEIAIDLDAGSQLDLTGITFTAASDAADFKFAPSTGDGLDTILAGFIADLGVTGTLEALTVNGNAGDAFRLVWDHLDDNYSYYNTTVNDAFIDLGIAYAKYLLDGGERLLDVAKFAADDGDAGDTPERSQTLHDNILGNLNESGIWDKFTGSGTNLDGDDAIYQRIIDAGLGDILGNLGNFADGRGYYGGYEGESEAQVRTFDDAFFG